MMKKEILNAKMAGVIAATLLLFATVVSSAATFTAVTSGNWGNSATWGGAVPPTTIVADHVIIPSGISVSVNDITLNGTLAVLEVNGMLSSAANTTFSIVSGTVAGTGQFNTDNVTIEQDAVIPFSGSLTANVLSCNLLNLPVQAHIMVIQALNLNSGVLKIETGGSLDVAEHAAVVLSGGVVVVNGGTIGLGSMYNVTYLTNPAIAGAELTGAGLYDVTIDVGVGNAVTLTSDLIVQGTLNLVSGYLDAGNYNAQISAGGSVSGMSNTAYVVTGASGRLSMYLNAGAPSYTLFPVGTGAHFFPVEVRLSPNSPSGLVYVSVNPDVYSAGTGGTDITYSQPAVDATWFVNSEITSNLDMNVKLMWPAAAQVNGFNYSAAYISNNLSGNWNVAPAVSAGIEPNGLYSLASNNIAYLSPFAVFDQNTIATEVFALAAQMSFEVYPNPASDNINVQFDLANYEPLYFEVLDILGSRLYSGRITKTNTTIPLTDFLPGNYFIRIYNNDISLVRKFIKDVKVR